MSGHRLGCSDEESIRRTPPGRTATLFSTGDHNATDAGNGDNFVTSEGDHNNIRAGDGSNMIDVKGDHNFIHVGLGGKDNPVRSTWDGIRGLLGLRG